MMHQSSQAAEIENIWKEDYNYEYYTAMYLIPKYNAQHNIA